MLSLSPPQCTQKPGSSTFSLHLPISPSSQTGHSPLSYSDAQKQAPLNNTHSFLVHLQEQDLVNNAASTSSVSYLGLPPELRFPSSRQAQSLRPATANSALTLSNYQTPNYNCDNYFPAFEMENSKDLESQLQAPCKDSIFHCLSNSGSAPKKSSNGPMRKLKGLFNRYEDYAPPPYSKTPRDSAVPTSNGVPAFNKKEWSAQAAQSHYDANMNNFQSSSIASPSVQTGTQSRDEELKVLAEYDTIFLIDDSHSMSWNLVKGNRSLPKRWESARDAIAQVVRTAMKYDSDGVDIQFLNSTEQNRSNCTTRTDVLAAFDSVETDNGTPTGERLGQIVEPYMKLWRAGKAEKKLNVVVITDGEANDGRDLRNLLIRTANELEQWKAPTDPSQVAISFCQIGGDAEATESLQSLDDNLPTLNNRDIVDVSYVGKDGRGNELTPDDIIKTLMGAISRKRDAQDSGLSKKRQKWF